MKLVSDPVHLALTYIAAVNRKGALLTVEQLDAFAVSPTPRGPVTRSPLRDSLARALSGYMEHVSPAESVSSYLKRVSWIEVTRGGVVLTDLGRAVLDDADRPDLADPSNEPMSVTIDPDDPMAYARIFHLISGHGSGLLIDPYLKFDGLVDVMEISGIDRVLTSNDNARNRLAIFARALGASPTPPAVRTTGLGKLHDRFFIPDEGPVFTLGSSLNSITKRPGVVTPIADEAASAAIRKAYAEIWNDADVVAATPTEGDDAEAGS